MRLSRETFLSASLKGRQDGSREAVEAFPQPESAAALGGQGHNWARAALVAALQPKRGKRGFAAKIDEGGRVAADRGRVTAALTCSRESRKESRCSGLRPRLFCKRGHSLVQQQQSVDSSNGVGSSSGVGSKCCGSSSDSGSDSGVQGQPAGDVAAAAAQKRQRRVPSRGRGVASAARLTQGEIDAERAWLVLLGVEHNDEHVRLSCVDTAERCNVST